MRNGLLSRWMGAAIATAIVVMAFALVAPSYAAESDWTENDFTYGWWVANCEDDSGRYVKLDIAPAQNQSDALEIRARAVTGFSEQGLAKFEQGFTDLVLPESDGEGNPVQAVGDSAFSASSLDKVLSADKKGMRITSVEFPSNVMAPFSAQDMKSPELWNEEATVRGDFWIGASAFSGQGIRGTLELPEGVIYIGASAFSRNTSLEEVMFPTTITWVAYGAFGSVDTANKLPIGNISALTFPDETIFPLQLARQCFSGNKIKAAQLPSTLSYMDALTFLMNTGAGDPIVEGSNASINALAQVGTIVKLYVSDRSKLGASVSDKDNFATNGEAGVQELIEGAVPAQFAAWGPVHFTFSADGSTITGLTAEGKAKLAQIDNLIIPSKGPNGEPVAAIGAGASAELGTFAFVESGTTYQPASVVFPDGLASIGRWAFAGTNIASIALPTSVTAIDADAFAGAQGGDVATLLMSASADQIHASGAYVGIATEGSGHKVQGDLSRGSIDTIAPQKLREGAVEPDVVVRFCGSMLAQDVDYTLSFENNTGAGQARAIATGMGGFAGQTARPFVIESSGEIAADDVSGVDATYTYTGDPIQPVVTVSHGGAALLKDADYTVSYGANTEPGSTGTVTVAGIGSYTGEVTITFIIEELDPAWLAGDFAYSDDGSTIIGLTKVGKARLKKHPDVAIPAKSPSGATVTAIGSGQEGLGVLGYRDETASGEDGTSVGDQAADAGMPLVAADLHIGQGEAIVPTGLTLPDTLEVIGDWAFSGHRLTELEIPGSVRSIGQGAFSAADDADNPTLAAVILHEGVESIGAKAFAGAKLDAVSIPTTVTALDATAFAGNVGNGPEGKVVLTVLADGQATAAGDYEAFAAEGTGHTVVQVSREWGPADFTYDGATVVGLTPQGEGKLRLSEGALEIPDANADGVTTTAIGDGVFSTADPCKAGTFGFKAGGEWVYPTSVKLPASLERIGSGAFSGVYLSEVVKGDDGTEKTVEEVIGGLTAVQIPDTVTYIGDAAFNWAPLASVEIPDSVTYLGKAAFSAAQTLPGTITSAKLPAHITAIPEYLFNNQKLAEIQIPESVVTIERGAFRNNPLQTLVLPQSVQTIGSYAFQNHALTSLAIPPGVKSIGDFAFNVSGHNGGALAELVLNEGLESIGERAFQGASLRSVKVPTTLKVLESRAFNNNKNPDRADSRVVLESKVYDQAKGAGAYSKFIASETFTAHHGGGHLTLLDLASDQAVAGSVRDQEYADGKAVEPAVSMEWIDPDGTSHELVAGTDYTIAYEGNTVADTTATARITGNGVFTGEKAVSFRVKAAPAVPDSSVPPQETDDGQPHKAADGTSVGAGASASVAQEAITSSSKAEGPKGTVFAKLKLRSTKQTAKSVKLTWAKPKDAKTFIVFGAVPGKKMVKIKTLAGKSLTVKKIGKTTLKKGKYYRFMVVALDKNDEVVSTSKVAHVATKGGKAGNIGKVTTKAKKNKATLKEGKTFKLGAKQKAASKKLKVAGKRKLAYETSNAKIATVTKKGVVKAKKKGACYVYVYAQNGVFLKVKVTVR